MQQNQEIQIQFQFIRTVQSGCVENIRTDIKRMSRVKSHILILAILTTVAIIGMVTVNIQQVSAPRGCNGCIAFKKLTHEFENDVIDVAKKGDPNTIAGLLEQYDQDVLRAFNLTPRG